MQQKYLGAAVLGRKLSPVCLCLGDFFFLFSHHPQGSAMITVRHHCPLLSPASAEPSEHQDQAGVSVSSHKIWRS